MITNVPESALSFNEFDRVMVVLEQTITELKTVLKVSGVKDGIDRLDSIMVMSPHFLFREDKKQELTDLIYQDPKFASSYTRACGVFFARVAASDSFLLRLAYNLSQTVFFKENGYGMMSDNNKDSFLSVQEINAWFDDHVTKNSVAFAAQKTTEEKLAILLKENKVLMFSIALMTLMFSVLKPETPN